jgi:putative transposase
MIERTVEELTPLIETRPACRALGAAPPTIYRRRRPSRRARRGHRPCRRGRCRNPSARPGWPSCGRSGSSTQRPRRWATLLDEGRYLASERTMYRLLAANGEVREPRDQLTHPPYERPELLTERSNAAWSWDISKLKGPAKWTCLYLYAILDVFSRYCVGWTVQHRESASVAEQPIAQAVEQHVGRDQLTVHADRGSSMTSKPVAMLLADLGVTKTHSRPYTSTDNPAPRRSSRRSSTGPPSRGGAARWSTQGRSAASSSAGTTTSTAIQGSARVASAPVVC